MTQKIYKYRIKRDPQPIPSSATILKVDKQGYEIIAWCLVKIDSSLPQEPGFKVFEFYETGEELKTGDDELHHLATILFDEGSYVLHVFEKLERPF